jgi:hypothetical protein
MADMKKGSRITGTARNKLADELVKKYEKGASIRALAESTGRSYGFVHRILSESGVALRGRGGAVTREPRVVLQGGSRVVTMDSALLTTQRRAQAERVNVNQPHLYSLDDWPVSIYLQDGAEEEGRHVRLAVRHVLRDLGFDLTSESEPILGSFLQRARAKARDPQTKKALGERIAKLERSAEVHLLAVPESQANMQNAQGLAAIIDALKGERAAVIQLGPLLVVKIPIHDGESTVFCKTLTLSELKKLEQNPSLLADPVTLASQLSFFAEDPDIEQTM